MASAGSLNVSLPLFCLAVILLPVIFLAPNAAGFSMVSTFDDDENLSRKLHDMMDMEYAEEAPEETPVKRQQTQGGTCTCTCETRPVNEPKQQQQLQQQQQQNRPRQHYPESAVLMRTATGMKPESAARVLDQSTKVGSAEAKNSKSDVNYHHGNSDLHSKIIKVEPLDYSDMANIQASPDEEEEEEEEAEAKEADRMKVQTTPAPPVNKPQQSSDQLDAWGHDSRYPWKRLPDTMCFRESCKSDKECCMRYNLCDKSAKVCVDCWYGSSCTSEQDCCQRFPLCQRVWKKQHNGPDYVASGKCVNKL